MKILLLFAPLLLSFSSLALAADPKTESAVFSQYCFWTGEMRLGQIEGVVRTEAGFYDGHEVTKVDYDPARVNFAQLVRLAQKADVADQVYATNEEQKSIAAKEGLKNVTLLGTGYRKAPEDDQKKQIQGTSCARLSLTPEQATKANAFIRVDPSKAAEFVKNAQPKMAESR